MKLKGIKLEGPQERTVVLPRQEGENLVFKFRAILDWNDFENLCPVPKPPEVIKPGGTRVLELEHPTYLKALDEWSQQKAAYSFIRSISATDDLEWETIKMGDPETWTNYQKELEEAGLTESEIIRLLTTYSDVQGLDQTKIDKATKDFLAIPQEDTAVK